VLAAGMSKTGNIAGVADRRIAVVQSTLNGMEAG
jgi:basic membrane lipoprotein Med (substrate-binding protein (PBP1-ABC) superfamily)